MIAVVILAGGEGSRIGGDKPERLLRGMRLLDHALGLARQWSPLIAIAVSNTPPARLGGVPVLHDREGSGPIAGIAAALAFARAEDVDRVLTIPCDTPFLPLDLPDRLEGALTVSAGAAIAASSGRTHPSCSLWRASAAAAALSDYLKSGRGSLHGFAEAVGGVAVEWASEPLDPFFNINSMADLAEAEALIGRSRLVERGLQARRRKRHLRTILDAC